MNLKMILIAFTLGLSSMTFAGTKSVVVVPGVLVKAHGGQFKGDIVASQVIDQGGRMTFKDLRFETKHGAYFLVGGDKSIGAVVCEYAAPKGWFNYDFPLTSEATKGTESITFLKNGQALVESYDSYILGYDIRSEVWCSKKDLGYIGGE